MSVLIVPFEAHHIFQMDEQEATSYLRDMLPETQAESLAQSSAIARTAMVDGKVMACAGIVRWWMGSGEMWCYMDKNAGKHMTAIFREAKRMLEDAPFQRVSACVDSIFGPGHRLVQMLGFNLEAPCMKAYGPDGRDYALYARVT